MIILFQAKIYNSEENIACSGTCGEVFLLVSSVFNMIEPVYEIRSL